MSIEYYEKEDDFFTLLFTATLFSAVFLLSCGICCEYHRMMQTKHSIY